MKISTSTQPFDRLGSIEGVISALKEAGFDAYDYSMFYDGCRNTSILFFDNWKERAIALRKFADEIGIACNQSHAPFPSWKKGEEEYNQKTFTDIVKAIEITGILGGKVCVVHPWNDANAEENAAFYNRLLPVAKRCNVKIGVENMWNWNWGVDTHASAAACSHHDDFLRHMELLDKDWFVANVDIGHAEMEGLNTSAVEMLHALKDRVQALHIHDNDKHGDTHALPFTMQIDFRKICQALRDIGYQGDVTLEVASFARQINMPLELYPVYMSLWASVAKYFKSLIQK